jgi:hypothetical protein
VATPLNYLNVDEGDTVSLTDAPAWILRTPRSALALAAGDALGRLTYRTSYAGGFSPSRAALSRNASSRNANQFESIPLDR